MIPNHKFGFIKHHSATQQFHQLVDYIYNSLESKKYCPIVFIDISQAIDKVWHKRLLSKLKILLSLTYCLIILKVGTELSEIKSIKAGVPQGCELGPILFNIYMSDLVEHNNQPTTFANSQLR